MRFLMGLGDPAYDAEKLKLESQLGIPYTGPAQTAEELRRVQDIIVPIANGSLQAAESGLSFPDPFVQKVALDYLQRAFEGGDTGPVMGRNLVFWSNIDPALFQQIAGRPRSAEPWWRYARENQVGATLFPILGAGSGSAGGYARNLGVGFEYTAQNIYDEHFDFAALAAAAQRFAAEHASSITTPTSDAVTQAQGTTPLTSGPPSGWRPAHVDGADGWWGPDGRFYPGATPWSDGTQGISVQTFAAPVAPLSPASSGAGPSDSGAASPYALTPDGFLPDDAITPAVESTEPTWFRRSGGAAPVIRADTGSPAGGTATAGISGKGVALAAGVAGLLYLFGRSR